MGRCSAERKLPSTKNRTPANMKTSTAESRRKEQCDANNAGWKSTGTTKKQDVATTAADK